MTLENRKKFFVTLFALLFANAAQAGIFEILDCGDFKAHVYNSGDVMANTSLLIEGKESLVAMELPLFKENAKEFDAYIAKLDKPLVRVLSDYHEGAVANVPNLMPAGMPAFMQGEIYTGMMAHFKNQFGDREFPL